MKMILFDFEVFKYNWLVVFKEIGSDKMDIIIDDAEQLKKFYNDNKHNIFVGYNSKFYDNTIFRAILNGLDPYEITQRLIIEKEKPYNMKLGKWYKIISVDLMDELISVPSLKVIEGNMGMDIKESDVSFNIDRELTDDEIYESIEYCKQDVRATEKLFEARYDDYIKPKLMLISKFGLPIDTISKTFAGITSNILDARKRTRFDELQYDLPDHIEVKNKEILDLYKSPIDYKKKLKVDIHGVEHKLAYGGLHGALKNYINTNGNMVMLDVASYYPSMMIEYSYASRNLVDGKKYIEIYDDRLEMKANKNPMNQPYKIMLNATYGAMKNKYNSLYDPKQCNQICITGQLMLVELIEKLEKYCTLIQSNTDGILVEINDLEKIREISSEWQKKTKMVLEEEHIEVIYQKDVNNYVYVTDTGKIKVKGSYVNLWKGGNFERNSLSIIDEAVVKNLLYDIPIEKTIDECNDLIRFQMICNTGGKFEYTMLINPKEVVNKVNRVFASKEKNNRGIFKVKEDGSKHKFAGSPDHVLIYNGDMSDCKLSKSDIDIEWYYNVARNRINDFKGVK